jgi:TPP-dependent indolepyruvate ferredoxin oxidoreductase alpha subunit
MTGLGVVRSVRPGSPLTRVTVGCGFDLEALITRESLEDMGMGPGELERAGIRLLKISMVYPLDKELVRDFARGLRSIVVVEEKRDLLQTGIESALYALTERPEVVGHLAPHHRELRRLLSHPGLACCFTGQILH